MESADASFSVIIPAFNAERFLRRAIASALSQTLPPAEIIIIDDGSTDATAEIASSFGPPVRCVQQPNAGAAAARNRGIEEASGGLVAFLDADDEWLPKHLEDVAAVFAGHPELSWCSTGCERRSQAGRISYCGPAENQIVAGAFIEDYFEAAATWSICTPTMAIRRGVFSEVGTFDPELPTGEDPHLWFRIALRHPRIGYSRDVSVVWWVTEDSLTSQGLFKIEEARRYVRKLQAEAEALGRGGERAIRRYVVMATLRPLRWALLKGDREVLSWAVDTFAHDAPAMWRWANAICSRTPPPLWALAVRIWEGTRPLRMRARKGGAGR